MFSPVVVEVHPAANAVPGLGDAVVGVEVDFCVFEAAPEPFDERVVDPTAFAVHADLDARIFEHLREVLAGELAALVGVEDFGPAVLGQRLVQRRYAKARIQRVGQPSAQHFAAVPVHDRHEADEAFSHRDVRDVLGGLLAWFDTKRYSRRRKKSAGRLVGPPWGDLFEVLDVVGALPLIGGFAIFLVAVAGLVMSGESIDFSTLIAYAIIVLLIGKLLRRGIHGFEKLGVMMIVLLMVFLVLL